MKKPTFLFLLLCNCFLQAQYTEAKYPNPKKTVKNAFAISQEYRKPSEGKSLVYFVRTPGMGSLVNFKFFDGEQFLGKMKGTNYFTYECDPGDHLFWVSSENRDFIHGKLVADATYIFVAKPQAGALKTRVKLEQVFLKTPS